ncbi:sulfur carrier protein ThiS [Sphingobacterium sp. Mn56C]|uniref:sulfur carrier protein ThiS n=1 Tax=Sphingobacterium sp. Mn56C TaxID=3395261 RepID=UPI003BC142A0
MKINVNNQSREVQPSVRLSELMDELLNGSVQGTAVAVNDVLIPRSSQSSYLLQENDSVLIITAAQGG